jgi:hypothetical protein
MYVCRVSRPALGSTQPPFQSVPVVVTSGLNQQVRELTSHFHLVPRARMVVLYIHFPICLHCIVFS